MCLEFLKIWLRFGWNTSCFPMSSRIVVKIINFIGTSNYLLKITFKSYKKCLIIMSRGVFDWIYSCEGKMVFCWKYSANTLIAMSHFHCRKFWRIILWFGYGKQINKFKRVWLLLIHTLHQAKYLLQKISIGLGQSESDSYRYPCMCIRFLCVF